MQNAERFWELHSHKSLKPPKTVELLNNYLQVFSELELVPVPLKESRTGKLIPMFQWGEVKSVDDAKKLLSQMSIDDVRMFENYPISIRQQFYNAYRKTQKNLASEAPSSSTE